MNAQRLLAWAILLVGIVEILAFGAVVMPRAWMADAHRRLGLGEFPDTPVVETLMRQVSFTYALHGVAMCFIAMDVARYRPLVVLAAWGYLLTAPVFIVIDVSAGLPWYWSAGNGGSCLVVGVVLFVLLSRDRKAISTDSADLKKDRQP